VQQFRDSQPAALFGLACSGRVDVPGNELSHVILTRLPFPVPDHPLEKGARGALERDGGDAFMALSLAEGGAALQAGLRSPDPTA